MIRQADPFEENARHYDAWFDQHKIEYDLELQAITALLPTSGKGIEIGAGTGRFSQPLNIALAVEPSESMRSIAQERGVHIIAGTVESLPVADRSYDYALLVTVTCFLESLPAALKEVHRILKPEGYIILGLIDNTCPF